MDAVDDPLREALAEGYFDVEATLTGWQEARAGELVLAQEAHDHAEQESAKVDRRLAKVQTGWQDSILTDDEYAAQRSDLLAEREGATAALHQAKARVSQLERAVAESDVQPVLDALEALKTADLDEFRRILRSMFEGFVLIPLTAEGHGAKAYEHPNDGGEAEVTHAGRRYQLMPRLRPEFIDDGWEVIRQPLPGSAPQLNTSPPRGQWA
jgi:hypothetical protein